MNPLLLQACIAGLLVSGRQVDLQVHTKGDDAEAWLDGERLRINRHQPLITPYRDLPIARPYAPQPYSPQVSQTAQAVIDAADLKRQRKAAQRRATLKG